MEKTNIADEITIESNSDRPKGPDMNERYRLLISARNFHYDNFSKWASYFYVSIGALFVAYYSIVSSEKIDPADKRLLSYVILILGFLSSILWYWSVKGYYYWALHFITMVQYFETNHFRWEPEGSVYSVFVNRHKHDKYGNPFQSANFSTSKIAVFFAYIITIAWGFLFIYRILLLNCIISTWPSVLRIILSVVFAIAIVLWISKFIGKKLFQSDISVMKDLQWDFKKQNDGREKDITSSNDGT